MDLGNIILSEISQSEKDHMILLMWNLMNKQVLARMWRKGNSFALFLRMQIDAASVESSIEIPQ